MLIVTNTSLHPATSPLQVETSKWLSEGAVGVTSLVKQNTYQSVASVEDGDDDWPGNNLLEVINWLTEKAVEIPLPYQAGARCTISTIDRGEDSWATLTVYYYRPETPEETETRILQAQEITERARQRELAELDRLLNKYPEHRHER
jgi:hypothetical protein